LGRIGSEAAEAVPALIKVLNNDVVAVSSLVLGALEKIGTPEAKQVLKESLAKKQ